MFMNMRLEASGSDLEAEPSVRKGISSIRKGCPSIQKDIYYFIKTTLIFIIR